MDTRQLKKILSVVLPYVKHGVYAEDELPMDVVRPFAMIVNTDPSSEEGTHWTAIYLKKDKSGEFFDSSGAEPDKPVRCYLDEYATFGWEYNTRQIQGLLSTLCGAYCIQYLVERSVSHNSFSSLLYQLFPFKNNDIIVQQRMMEHYRIRLPIFDKTMFKSL